MVPLKPIIPAAQFQKIFANIEAGIYFFSQQFMDLLILVIF